MASAAQFAPEGGERRIGIPGFENLSGAIRMEGGAGTLELAGNDVTLVFPGVFEEPRLPLRQLLGSIHWRQAATLELRAENLRASNDDVDVTANGTYRSGETGPGSADIVGRIARAGANTAHRYIPAVVGLGTRRWLEHAIVKGRLNDGTFRLKGDLARFPFINPSDGDFRLADGASARDVGGARHGRTMRCSRRGAPLATLDEPPGDHHRRAARRVLTPARSTVDM